MAGTAAALEKCIADQVSDFHGSGPTGHGFFLKIKGKTAGRKRSAEGVALATKSLMGPICQAFNKVLQYDARAAAALQHLNGVEIRHAGLTAIDVAENCDYSRDRNNTEGSRSTPHPPRSDTLVFFLLHRSRPWQLDQLVTLDLESNSLGNEGLRLLCITVLPHLPNVSRLLLASNSIGSEGLIVLRDALELTERTVCPHLAVLGLTNNPLSEHTRELGAVLSSIMLAREGSIHRLHINHVGLDTDNATMLIQSTLLRSHSLSWAARKNLPPGISGAAERQWRQFPALECIYAKQNALVDVNAVKEQLMAGDDAVNSSVITDALRKRILL